ncbi:MAG: UvrD-helicase domain-containing protein [Anaerolineae bacterium]
MADNIEKLLEYGRMDLEAGYPKYAHEYFEQVLVLDATNKKAREALAEIDNMLAHKIVAASVRPSPEVSRGRRISIWVNVHSRQLAFAGLILLLLLLVWAPPWILLGLTGLLTAISLCGLALLLSKERERPNYLAKIMTEVNEALRHCEFERADQLQQELKMRYPDATIPGFEARVRKTRELLDSLKGKLKHFYFTAADELAKETHYIAREKYEDLKKHYIEQYVNEHLPSFPINDEQAEALANTNYNLLVGARAGSGKTRLIAYKTALLLQEGVPNPDELMILAFNVNAATEIRNRIRREFGFERFENARTFHSLAHRLVNPEETLLFDEKGDSIFTEKLSLFVQGVLTSIIDPAFREQMYTVFRQELAEIEEPGQVLSDEDYYTYRRSMRQTTLRGELVKSKPEKWVADFLFEHDILSYTYEELCFWGGGHYHPDFSIFYRQKKYIIEHWAIDENHREELPSWWRKSWEEYRQEMQRKRRYWREKNVVLIETSRADMQLGREHFEAILKQKLENAGIICSKLPQEELYEKVEHDHLSRFAKMVTQFIQNAKKKGLSPTQMQREIDAYQPRDERESVFLQLATRVYKEYEQEKEKQSRIDFDDLLTQATQRVHETEGRCDIRVDHQRHIRMNDLHWIMIDEYQDFSPLFYQLIQSIREYNPNVRLLCVGDDWQAINAFAGSELTFFEEFEEKIGNAETTHLLTNHRSQAKIIENSNALMDGGPKAVSLPDKRGGLVQIEFIDDTWLELSKEEAYRADKRFHFLKRGESVNVIPAKYAKRCYQIITDPENVGKTVAILSRTNEFYSVSLEDFRGKLIECLNEEDKEAIGKPKDKIQVETVHRFKGLEAEIVILVRACEDAHPLIHPDNVLFAIFGRNEADIIDEERRLFYVALTRAKEKLYILTERDRESPFLRRLPEYPEHYEHYGDLPF